MLKIKLKRIGRKNNPFFKIILTENLKKRKGSYFKELGFYDPLKKIFKINKVLIKKYLNYGAIPTHTVRHLLLKIIK